MTFREINLNSQRHFLTERLSELENELREDDQDPVVRALIDKQKYIMIEYVRVIDEQLEMEV